MRDTAEEAKTKSLVTFSNGPVHTDVVMLADQQEIPYNTFVRTHDVV